MKRRAFAWLLLVGMFAPLLAETATAARAPQQGFVLVRAVYEDGSPAAFQPVVIEKLEGAYAIPPGPYSTNAYGQVWIGLYPGVYRFSLTEPGTQPTSWTVSVASRGEYYILFTVPAPLG